MISLLTRAAVAVCALALVLSAPTAASAAPDKKRCASAKGQAKSKGGASRKSCAAKTRRAKKVKKGAVAPAATRVAATPGPDPDPVTDIADPGTVITDPGTDIADPGTDIPAPGPALNPAQQCRAEREDPNFAAAHGGESFEEFYGTNRNRRNAFGKCVSGKAKAQGGEDAEDAEDEDEDEDEDEPAPGSGG